MGEEPIRVYISGPAHNDVMKAGLEKICGMVADAGMVFTTPAPSNTLEERLPVLKESALFLAWLDGLMPAGITMIAAGGLQKQLSIPFDPETQKVIDAGWQATGRGVASLQSKNKRTILLPGEVDACVNSPKGMNIGLPGNAAICQVCSPPLNIPDSDVLLETGIAIALGIPMLLLFSAPPMAGEHLDPTRNAAVGSLDNLPIALKTIKEASTIADGLASILKTNLEDFAKMEEEASATEERNP